MNRTEQPVCLPSIDFRWATDLYVLVFRLMISSAGPSKRSKAFLPSVAHLSLPLAVMVAARGLLLNRASSVW